MANFIVMAADFEKNIKCKFESTQRDSSISTALNYYWITIFGSIVIR